jgi:class 3 adenylate cyclase/tetratricopeptide (TPR) repeat protein
MKCPTCRSENAEAASFCGNCGGALYRICPRCRHRNTPTARYCVECGTRTGDEPATSSAPPNRSDLLAGRSIGDGERKFVTILFADIVDSTRLIENMEPDEAASRLFEVLNIMRNAIRRFDGTVNKMQGDGLMALFGAPIPQEDHSVRACCAALAMQEAVVRFGSARIRIGMHTGEAVVQTISNDLAPQYDAMGVAVHIAARIEQAAGSFGIVLTAATLQASRGMINVESLGVREFKGLSKPIEVFVLRSIRSVAASQQFLGGQRLSGFVGRTSELLKLNKALGRAISGASPIVGIVGEPGAGKSRLVFEFIMACRLKEMRTIEIRATAHGQVTPLRPVLDLTRLFFSVSAEDPAEVARARINARLAGLGLIADGPIIMDFLGIRDPARQSAPAVVHQELLGAFRRIAEVVGQLTPAVVLFEDLHWLDEASEAFLSTIVEGLAHTHVLLLCNFRPGYRREWMDRGFYEQIILQPLGTSEIGALALELVGSDESTRPIRAQIIDRAAGNPFFTEELVRALLDQGALAGARGNYKRVNNVAVGALPSTVRGVIGFRIDRLEKEEKLFLEGASVIGREFPVDLATEVVGMEASTARVNAHKLLELEMLYEHTDRTDGVLAFKHPLVQEVAYASLVSDRRRSLHRRAAAALARQFAGSLEEHAALVAHHWDEGGEPVQAAASYMMSANWIGTRDPAEATRTWERVRKIVTAMLPAPHVNYMRLMACGQIINLSWRENAAIERLQPIYDEAMAIAKQQRDVRAAALITMAYGRVLLATGSADDYLAYIEEAQVLSSEKSNPSVEAMLAAVQSHAVGQAGFLPRALALNEAALKHVEQIEPTDKRMLGFDPKYWLWALRARYLLQTNDPIGAEQQLQKLLTSTSENPDAVHRAVALGICIDAASLDRDARRAMAAADALEETSAAKSASPYLSVLSKYFCGVGLLAADDRLEARRRLSTALSLARESRAGLELEPLILANLAEASSNDSLTEALGLAEEARRLARRRSQRVAELFANSSLIRIQTKVTNRVEENSRSEFDRLVKLTGATRLKLRIQNVV